MRRVVVGLMLAAGAAFALEPQTVTPAGVSSRNGVGVQGVDGGLPINVVVVSGGSDAGPASTVAQGAAGAEPWLVDGTVTVQNAAVGDAVAVRCVSTDGTTFEACGGTGAAGLTDAELRATPVPVSGTVTVGALPATAATTTKQDTGNTSLASLDGKAPVLGQALAAGSVPVVLTAAQITTLTPVSSVSVSALPATAATTAKQDTGNTSVASIDTKTPALGQALAAASVPVVLTAAQIATLTPLSSVTVSGTVTTTPPSNASTNVAQVAGTTTDTNSGAKSAGTLRVVLATDQPALTNKLLVTPDSVALPANQSVNVSQLAGTTTDTNSGAKSAGTLRVVLATDQPALTNKLLVTPDANSAVNLAQVAGASVATGNGTAAGAVRVALPTDGTGVVGLIAGTALVGKVGVDQTTPGTTNAISVAQIGATTVVNGGLAGTLGVGGTAGNNAVITQNPFVVAYEARSSVPTVATEGRQIRAASDLAGNQFAVAPLQWSCALDAVAGSLQECKAVASAGFSHYVTSWIAVSTTATAATYALRQGTGSACATGTAGVAPGASTSRTYVLPGSGAAAHVVNMGSGIKLTAGAALCVIGAATNTTNIVITGFTAP